MFKHIWYILITFEVEVARKHLTQNSPVKQPQDGTPAVSISLMVSPPVSISRSVSWCNCPKQKHRSQQENISQRLQAAKLHLQRSEKEAFNAGQKKSLSRDVGPFISKCPSFAWANCDDPEDCHGGSMTNVAGDWHVIPLACCDTRINLSIEIQWCPDRCCFVWCLRSSPVCLQWHDLPKCDGKADATISKDLPVFQRY